MALTKFGMTNIHNHTVFSDGQSTVWDYVGLARAYKVREFGISDHALNLLLPFSCIGDAAVFGEYLEEIERANKNAAGIRILKGLEVTYGGIQNLISTLGDRVFSLEYLLVESYLVWTPRMIETASGIRETLGMKVVSLAHPIFSGSADRIVEQLQSRGLCVELNSGHKTFTHPGQGKYFRKIIQEGVPVTFGSDSHSAERLNDLDAAFRFYEKTLSKSS